MTIKNHDKAYRVMASVYPTPRPNAKHRRLSSGRVPLYDYSNSMKFINVSINGFGGKYG